MGDSRDVFAAGEDRERLWELRRHYHDRIADLRQSSVAIARFSVDGVGVATRALVAGDSGPIPALRAGVEELRALTAAIDDDAVGLLALESPVARDLRMILASRDVAQIGLLCAGLCVALTGRAGGAERSIVPPVDALVADVSACTTEVLAGAVQAWTALDGELAAALGESVAEARLRQTRLVGAILDLDGVPIEAALDLAMATRAFDRLVDHGEEIADRVRFAVGPVDAG